MAPGRTVTDDKPLVTAKSGGIMTFRVAAPAAREIVPLVPVTTICELPNGVVASVVMVSVLAPPPATEAGLNTAVAPTGKPEALNTITPLKPFVGGAVTV